MDKNIELIVAAKRNALVLAGLLLLSLNSCDKPASPSSGLSISENKRFFTTGNDDPFFWLGDTGWLLFSRLDREEAVAYLKDRKEKGFNVIQVMVIHEIKAVNIYGDSALLNKSVATPAITPGNSFSDSVAYDYWDHIDFMVDQAAKLDVYMAMVPVWGSNVKAGFVNEEQTKIYAKFLADRYKDKRNIIWLNGGDIRGTDRMEVWQALGSSLKENDPQHLVTFHPRGRTPSSQWFHNEAWLDFNMFQSGHRRYDQDTSKAELRYGEDNWRYVNVDYTKEPVKPTLDAEPSYEGIPQGLHDTTEVRWKDNDVRRYGYWSVFAGGAGYTYGHNSVMQMLKPGDTKSAYGAKDFWYDALHAPGATQMIHLKELMLSRSYFERVPDSSMVADQGKKYDYVAATRGNDYAFFYVYTGRNFTVNLSVIKAGEVKATWFNPRDGVMTDAGKFVNDKTLEFDPPGSPQEGNDWVLIIDAL